jgi:hypothetical protein
MSSSGESSSLFMWCLIVKTNALRSFERGGNNHPATRPQATLGVYSFFLILSSFNLLIVRVEGYCFTRLHSSTRHTQYDSSGRGIGPSQRPLPDNTKQSQQTDIHTPSRIRNRGPEDSSRLRPLDFRAIGIWRWRVYQWKIPKTTPGIETATFLLVAQFLNQLPNLLYSILDTPAVLHVLIPVVT